MTPARQPLHAGITAWLAPALLLAAALLASSSGLDIVLEDSFFDSVSMSFPWRSNLALEALGHQALRSLVAAVWILVLSATVASRWVEPWRESTPLLLATSAGMVVGPTIVAILKEITTFPCPWNLTRYGGFALAGSDWFTTPASAGHCFPAGHAAGGFSLIAIAFGLSTSGNRRTAGLALIAALMVGMACAAVRLMQGAHFLSYALWSGAIDWTSAVLVFRGFDRRYRSAA